MQLPYVPESSGMFRSVAFPIFPCDRRCRRGSLNASETGASETPLPTRPWEGVVEGTAGGINRDDQNLNSLQEILLKSMPFWTEPRTDECHFLSLKLSSICCALMNSIVPRPIRCCRCWSN